MIACEEILAQRFAHDDRVFVNKRPLSRRERHASKDKESKEKALLEQRPPVKGQRYINYGRSIASAQAGTVAYITEQDRFITDFAAEEKRRREEQTRLRDMQLTTRRSKNVAAEEQRWKKIEGEWSEREAREAARKSRAVPRNGNSVPYNPLTLQYEPTQAGDMLRFTDDQIRFRAALRAERLRYHEAKEGFNPITGEAMRPVQMPKEPQPPVGIEQPSSGRPF